MAEASVTATTGATLDGRALARTGGVTLDTNDGCRSSLSIRYCSQWDQLTAGPTNPQAEQNISCS